jgi:hypothetical protein
VLRGPQQDRGANGQRRRSYAERRPALALRIVKVLAKTTGRSVARGAPVHHEPADAYADSGETDDTEPTAEPKMPPAGVRRSGNRLDEHHCR